MKTGIERERETYFVNYIERSHVITTILGPAYNGLAAGQIKGCTPPPQGRPLWFEIDGAHATS